MHRRHIVDIENYLHAYSKYRCLISANYLNNKKNNLIHENVKSCDNLYLTLQIIITYFISF